MVLKTISSTIRRRESNNSPTLDFLHKYHDPNRLSPLWSHQPPLCPIRVTKRKKKKALHEREGKLNHQFILDTWEHLSSNNLDLSFWLKPIIFFRTYVVALGISTHPGDKNPPVWHHGMDIDTAMALSTKLGDRRLNKVPAAYWHPPVDISCTAPEDGNKRRVWTVQFVCVPQMVGTNVASSSNGLFPVELFPYYFEFGQEDLTLLVRSSCPNSK